MFLQPLFTQCEVARRSSVRDGHGWPPFPPSFCRHGEGEEYVRLERDAPPFSSGAPFS